MNQIIMINRKCSRPECTRHFNVSISSSQWFCSQLCNSEMPDFKPPKKETHGKTRILLKEELCQSQPKEKMPPGLSFGNVWPSQKKLQRFEKHIDFDATPTKEQVTIDTKIKIMQNDYSGQNKIDRSRMKLKGKPMLRTEQNTQPKYNKENSKEIQQEDSIGQSLITEMAKSVDQSLINDSAKHLYSLLRDASKSAKDKGDVLSACACAKNITSLLRLKLDIAKASK